jgi:hypothetical protein
MKWKAGALSFCLLPTIFLVLPSFVFASDNALNILFQPLHNLDLSSFYDAYHFWIDFFIFLCLFVSVGRFTLGRRFGGREGNVVSVVSGLALALSLSLLEYKVGFSIKSFGPFAAGILILLVGMVIFYLIKAIGAGNTGAGSFAFAISYFLIRATLPDLILTLEGNSWFAWLDFGLMVAVLISIWKIIGSLWSDQDMRSFGRVLERSRGPENKNLRRNINDEKQEMSLIKRDIKGIIKEGMKEGGSIIDRLREMVKIIEEYGSTDKARHLIAKKLNQIAAKENLVLKQVARLRDLSQKLGEFDLTYFKELRARWDKVPDRGKDIVREEILLEKNKIITEKQLKEMEASLIRNDNDFRFSVSAGVECLRSNQPAQARDWLLKGIKCEEGALTMMKEMKEIENRLLKLTKMEFKTLKKEWKDENG